MDADLFTWVKDDDIAYKVLMFLVTKHHNPTRRNRNQGGSLSVPSPLETTKN